MGCLLSLLEKEEKEAGEGGQRPKSAVMQAPWQPQPPPWEALEREWPFRGAPRWPDFSTPAAVSQWMGTAPAGRERLRAVCQ